MVVRFRQSARWTGGGSPNEQMECTSPLRAADTPRWRYARGTAAALLVAAPWCRLV